ncbi:MAG: hypothetical protein IH571_05445 [Acholeplasmataceae bacterium]|nr:hypothetical protein [Acholeplasmataceae bacterium]
MSLKTALKKPLHKEDLWPVVRQGIFLSITAGLLIGAVTLFTSQMFSFSLYWLLFLIFGQIIGRRIKQSYVDYHILFSLLTVFFWVFGVYIMYVTYYAGIMYMVA